MILAIDPGASRLGWAILDQGEYVTSGIQRCDKREDESYQDYRLRLTQETTEWIQNVLAAEPDITLVANEILPAVGFNNAVQAYLANVALTAVHAEVFKQHKAIVQIGANSVKVRVVGNKKATKVAVRNGVIAHFPELAERKSDWTKEFDESDAIAIGISAIKGKK